MFEENLNSFVVLATNTFLIGLIILPLLGLLFGATNKKKLFTVAATVLFLVLVTSVITGFYLLNIGKLRGATGLEPIAWLLATGYFLGSLFVSILIFMGTKFVTIRYLKHKKT